MTVKLLASQFLLLNTGRYRVIKMRGAFEIQLRLNKMSRFFLSNSSPSLIISKQIQAQFCQIKA